MPGQATGASTSIFTSLFVRRGVFLIAGIGLFGVRIELVPTMSKQTEVV